MPGKVKSLIGQTFGRLFILADAGWRTDKNGKRNSLSLCRCSCGKEVILGNNSIRLGNTTSCGCFRREAYTKRFTKHGHATLGKPSRTYASYSTMIQRCTNPNNNNFALYGAIGITVCPRWRESFENFLADMGECPPTCEIDRWPDKNGIYEPGNTRWATKLQQARNKRNNRVFTVRGVTACIAELVEHFGIPHKETERRLRKGWPLERAFFEPLHKRVLKHSD